MTINWTMVAAQGGFNVMSSGDCIAVLRTTGGKWSVRFAGRSELDFEWSGETALNVCVGYVRGIERCDAVKAAANAAV